MSTMDEADTKLTHGKQLLESGAYEDAITLFTDAISLNPNLVDAYTNRAEAYQSLGMEDQSKADLEVAESIVSTSYDQRDSSDSGTSARVAQTETGGEGGTVPLTNESGTSIRLRWLRAIALLEIIGGAVGAGVTLWFAITNLGDLVGSFILLLIFLGFAGLFLLSVLAGVYLWKSDRRGIPFSILVHALQIPHLVTILLTYIFVSGASLTPMITSEGFSIDFKIVTGAFEFAFGTTEQTALGINLFAVMVVVYLVKLRRVAPLEAR